MSEHWPPEWDDPDAENLDVDDLDADDLGPDDLGPDDLGSGHLASDDRAQRAEMAAALASMPLPALPAAFEARISAAIRAEAATRIETTEAMDQAATARSLSAPGSFPAAAGDGTTTAPAAPSRLAGKRRGPRRPGASRTSGPASARPPRRGQRRHRALQVIGTLAVCLVVAGFGDLIAHNSSSSSSSYSSAAAAAGSASALHGTASAGRRAPLPAGVEPGGFRQSPGFVVRETGTRYEQATLAGQARAALAVQNGTSSPAAEPAASADQSDSASSGSLSTGGFVPPAALAGCVDHLTGNQAPSLVDRATYAGRAAYIIVVPRRVWVVGLGCTAAKPELITSVALAGLSGNLRALGSV